MKLSAMVVHQRHRGMKENLREWMLPLATPPVMRARYSISALNHSGPWFKEPLFTPRNGDHLVAASTPLHDMKTTCRLQNELHRLDEAYNDGDDNASNRPNFNQHKRKMSREM